MTGEKIPGDLNTWDYFGTDPNELLTLNYDILCQRSTTLFHTHPPVAAAINKNTMYAIGDGLHFRSQPDWQMLGMTKEAAKDWGMRFQKLVHYVFQILNFYEKQALIFRTPLIMGDSLLFFDRITPPDGMPFDLIETGGDQINFKALGKKGQKVTLGILHDDYLRKFGMYLTNGEQVNFKDENKDQNVIQFYFKQMARQLRGYPLAYKIISAAKNNDRYWDATLARAVMESIILGTVNEDTEDTRNQALGLADSYKNTDGTTSAASLTSDGNVADMGPGSVLSYNNKSGGMSFSEPKTPSNNFDKMQAAYIEIVGMATDTPAEVILSKYSTSYTAHKGALNDFIKSYTQKRKTFVNHVCRPVLIEVAKYLFMNNLIEMPVNDFFENKIMQYATISGNWLGPIPGQINPLQEAKANETDVLNAFKLRSDVAAQNGNEYDNYIEEWQQEEAAWSAGTVESQVQSFIEAEQQKQEQDPEQDEDPQEDTEDENLDT